MMQEAGGRMEWLQRIQKALRYMEEHLLDELTVDDVSNYVFSSKYNFQRVFHMVTGVTLGEYIRNRRLSLAGRDLQCTDSRVFLPVFRSRMYR